MATVDDSTHINNLFRWFLFIPVGFLIGGGVSVLLTLFIILIGADPYSFYNQWILGGAWGFGSVSGATLIAPKAHSYTASIIQSVLLFFLSIFALSLYIEESDWSSFVAVIFCLIGAFLAVDLAKKGEISWGMFK